MTTKKATVLIVEDDFALSDAFSMILKHAGHDAVMAYNGQEALEYLEHSQPDLILLDILMPIMDGRDFLMNFHNEHEIPIIALSNLDAKTDIERIVKLGATDYMLKSSVTPETLSELVAHYVA